MSSSTSDPRALESAELPRSPFRWPTGPWMLTLIVLITIGSMALLGAMANPMTTVGAWGYAAWPAAVLVSILAMVSATRFARGEGAGRPPDDPIGLADPPFVRQFHRRMGGWGTFVATIGQIVSTATASAAVAVVVVSTLLPVTGVAARLWAVGYLGLLVLMRAVVPEPRRVVTVVVGAAVLGLLALALHLETVGGTAAQEAARPRAAVTPSTVLEATALLPLAFLPLMRMGAMASGLEPARRARFVRWALPLTIAAGAGLGAFLGQAIEGILDPVSTTGAALAEALSEGSPAVSLAARATTLVLGTLLTLVCLDDTVLVASRLMRYNAVPDIFGPPPGGRVSAKGEVVVLALVSVAALLAPRLGDLVAFSAFCVLVVFGSLHVVVMRPRSDGRHQLAALPLVGLMSCIALAFALPPGVIFTGVALVSVAILLRAVFIVWSEPLVPDIVEGVGGSEGSRAATTAGSAAAARGAEDAAGDLPPDHRAGRAQHGAERRG